MCALLALPVLGCTETTELFSALDDPDRIEIRTVEDGAMLTLDEPVSVAIESAIVDADPPTLLRAELYDAGGPLVAVESTSDDAGQVAPLDVPTSDLPAGTYQLVVTAWRGASILAESRRTFYRVSRPASIDSLSLYPSSVGRDHDSVAIAEVRAPADQMPYARWYVDDRLVTEGYLARGYGRVVIPGDGSSGVDDVRLELLPWGPDEGVSRDSVTALVQRADRFVRGSSFAAQSVDDGAAVLARYRLDGSLQPEVAPPDTDGAVARRDGEVVLDVVDGVLGYRLSGPSSLVVPVGVLATDGGATRLVLDLAVDRAATGRVATVVLGEEGDTLEIPILRDGPGVYRFMGPDNPITPVDDGGAGTPAAQPVDGDASSDRSGPVDEPFTESVSGDGEAASDESEPAEAEADAGTSTPAGAAPDGAAPADETGAAVHDGLPAGAMAQPDEAGLAAPIDPPSADSVRMVSYGGQDAFPARVERVALVMRRHDDTVRALLLVDGIAQHSIDLGAPAGVPAGDDTDQPVLGRGMVRFGGTGAPPMLVSEVVLERVSDAEFARAERAVIERRLSRLVGDELVDWVAWERGAPREPRPWNGADEVLLLDGPGFVVEADDGAVVMSVARTRAGLEVRRGSERSLVELAGRRALIALAGEPGSFRITRGATTADLALIIVRLPIAEPAGLRITPIGSGSATVLAFVRS